MQDNSGAAAYERADWLTRLMAEIIDYAAWFAAWVPVAIGIIIGIVIGGAAGVMVGLFGFFVTVGFLYAVATTYMHGQSVGKRMMGTRVIRTDGSPVGWGFNLILRQILIKFLVVGTVGEVSLGIFFLLNYLWPLWDREQQAVHDKMASTYVVRVHPVASAAPPTAWPDH